nr:glucosaminidase domain-containing protein [uncultured Romboutsia sp.]
MGKKKIKHLGKKRRKNKSIGGFIKKTIILLGTFISLITFIYLDKHIKELYKGVNIEESAIEFYIDMADEIGNKEVQLSWQELMAIDMVRYEEDLTNIKKKDVIDIGKKFIKNEDNEQGDKVKKVKSFDKVIDELGFDKQQKNLAKKYLEELKGVSLSGDTLKNNDEKVDFVKKISELSYENYEKYNILPSITVGQAILESSWGESDLTKKSNNIFGIKADARWNGKVVKANTSENYNDKIVDAFRKYDSMKDSINDHGKFLSENKRYEESGLFKAKHYTTQAQALEDAGYATKKNEKGELIYADILIDLIKKYNLQLLDRKVQTN